MSLVSQLKQKSNALILSSFLGATSLIFNGCGSMSVAPAQIYSLQCAWCNNYVSSGEYQEFGNGNILRTTSRRMNLAGIEEGTALIVGNTRQENIDEIIQKDLGSLGGFSLNGKIYCSQRCASYANKGR